MNLDINLVFKDTDTTFHALAAGLSGFIGNCFFGFARYMLQVKYPLQYGVSDYIFMVVFIIVAVSSFFIWIFTDCMMRKLCIFISLIILAPATLAVSHADIFTDSGSDAEAFVAKIGMYVFAVVFPLLNVPLIPETIKNIKTFRNSQYDNKVNDFAAAVSFAFGRGGTTLIPPLVNIQFFYLEFPFDFLLATTITFTICYACYVNIKHSCRKDKEEEEAVFKRMAQQPV